MTRSRTETLLISCGALAIWLVFVHAAFFDPRTGGVDEVSLFNPAYLKVRTGHMGYASYGFPQGMFIHPPVHVGFVALLMNCGLPLYYAEAIPAMLWLTLALLGILCAPLAWPLRVGLLTGLFAPVYWLGHSFASFGMRPDLEVYATWMAGLIYLEWGRLREWDWRILALGAFFLTYASATHYYAAFSLLGVLVYMVWALRSLNRRRAWLVCATLAAGGLVVGFPYLALFVIPMWRGIQLAIAAHQDVSGPLQVIESTLSLYRSALPDSSVLWPLRVGIPAALISTVLYWLVPSARGLALAALPLQLFLLLFASHKNSGYLSHELAMYGAAIWTAALASITLVTARLKTVGPRLLYGVSLLPLAWMILHSADFQRLKRWTPPEFHELDVARAAGKEILGPGARVGYRLSRWYVGGETHWYMVERGIHRSKKLQIDPNYYFPVFDAILATTHFSEVTANEDALSSSAFFAMGTLTLRGFFWSQDDGDFSYLLLAAHRPERISGFVRKNNRLHRFDEDATGDFDLVSAVCPPVPEETAWRKGARWSHLLLLPRANYDNSKPAVDPMNNHRIASVIYPSSAQKPRPPACQEIVRIKGRLTEADTRELVAKLRRDDPVVQFHQTLEGFAGPERAELAKRAGGAPPGDAVRLTRAFGPIPGAARAGYVRAGSGRDPVRVRLSVPQPVEGPCWVEARLRVTRGVIRLVAHARGIDLMIAESLRIGAGPTAKEVFLSIPACDQFEELIARNDDELEAAAVTIERLDLWIEQEAWKKHEQRLHAAQ